MAFGFGRHHSRWDDATDTLSRYRDRAQDLYDEGRRRTADVYDQGLSQGQEVYGRGRRRAADVYGESRRRAANAVDAVAGRDTTPTVSVASAATLGILAGAALTFGAIWWLRRQSQKPVPAPLPPVDAVDELLAGDAA